MGGVVFMSWTSCHPFSRHPNDCLIPKLTLRAVDCTGCVSVAFLSSVSWFYTDKSVSQLLTFGAVVVPVARSEIVALELGIALVAAATVSIAVTVTVAVVVAEALVILWLFTMTSHTRAPQYRLHTRQWPSIKVCHYQQRSSWDASRSTQ